MSLKDKLLQNKEDDRCKDCKHFEIVNEKTPYCNAHDKLVLEMHIDTKRICTDYAWRDENEYRGC